MLKKSFIGATLIIVLSLFSVINAANMSLPFEEDRSFSPPDWFQGSDHANIYVTEGIVTGPVSGRVTGHEVVAKINNQEWLIVSGQCFVDAFYQPNWSYNGRTGEFSYDGQWKGK